MESSNWKGSVTADWENKYTGEKIVFRSLLREGVWEVWHYSEDGKKGRRIIKKHIDEKEEMIEEAKEYAFEYNTESYYNR